MSFPKYRAAGIIVGGDWDALTRTVVNYGASARVIVDGSGQGDYDTLQEAVDALPATNAGKILVKKGEYLLTQAVDFDSIEDLTVSGEGKATRFKIADKVQELLALDANIGQQDATVADGSVFEVGQHVCVRDDTAFEVNRIASIAGNVLTMETNLAATYDVLDNGLVYTCHSAFYVTGTSKRIRITNLMIDGNRANQTFGREGYWPKEHQGDGIRISATVEKIIIDFCFLKSVVCHGICSGGDGIRIYHNEGWDNGYDAINVEPGSDQVIIKGNHCHDQAVGGWNGIQIGYNLNDIGAVICEGNHCYNNRQGIAAQGGGAVNSGIVIANNVLKWNREDGIEVYRCNKVSITGNIITGAGDLSDMTNAGIHVENESSIGLISGNLIEQVAGIGIYIENGAYYSVTGNTLRKIGKEAIKAGGLGRDGSITGNTIVGADQGDTATWNGIEIVSDRWSIVGNRLDDCDNYCIHLAGTADRCVVLGNQCTQYIGVGVGYILDEGTNNEVAHNIVT